MRKLCKRFFTLWQEILHRFGKGFFLNLTRDSAVLVRENVVYPRATPQPFAEDGRRKLHGQNLAAALLEGAVQRIDSALREPGVEILAVGPVPCTDPQAPCLLKTCFDLFFKSLGWTCKFGGSKKGQYLWKW